MIVRKFNSNTWLVILFCSVLIIFLLFSILFFVIKEQTTDQIASPGNRTITISPGLRKEQIAHVLGKELNWPVEEVNQFINANSELQIENVEGKLYPTTYIVPLTTTPLYMSAIMINKYNQEILTYISQHLSNTTNMDAALKIASIIERETNNSEEKKIISGIIWNRLKRGLNIQSDITVQYALGTTTNWWPKITNDQRTFYSPFNTYINKGLPPTPVSNPSLESIDAAFNPTVTSCFYYFFDAEKKLQCSETYEKQTQRIKQFGD